MGDGKFPGLENYCSENVDEEVVQQWINKYSTLESYEVLSDDDIVQLVVQKRQGILEKCPESEEENLATYSKLSHIDALVTH